MWTKKDAYWSVCKLVIEPTAQGRLLGWDQWGCCRRPHLPDLVHGGLLCGAMRRGMGGGLNTVRMRGEYKSVTGARE